MWAYDLFLVGMIVAVFAFAVTFVMHLFLVVPFVPTPRRVVEAMVDAAHLQHGEIVYDLGAGDGRLLIAAARKCPGIVARGCELVPTIWLLARLRLWASGVHADIRCRNLFKQPLHDADVIFLYMLPSVMERLERKLDAELRPDTRVVSHAFRFPGRTPEHTVALGPEGRPSVHVYRW
ncbi:MAG: SAM-dependent methyltransferase [Candidatus Peregrinibacteria bacterium Gr01-1014_25]|nr:MAG: SAM-dependent methyltransferase [Candidatus Peregrinibacteria bacterium Gr01-1014_25]